MLQHLKPDEAAIDKLALAETDLTQQARFSPVRRGFFGNLLLIAAAGALGLVHAFAGAVWRALFRPPPHDTP